MPNAISKAVLITGSSTGIGRATAELLAASGWTVYATTAARLLGRRSDVGDVERQRRLRTPPPVPCTSFYSRSDGIVAWQSCLDEASPWTENVEVQSSHCGMGHHPSVLLAIAERLARPAR